MKILILMVLVCGLAWSAHAETAIPASCYDSRSYLRVVAESADVAGQACIAAAAAVQKGLIFVPTDLNTSDQAEADEWCVSTTDKGSRYLGILGDLRMGIGPLCGLPSDFVPNYPVACRNVGLVFVDKHPTRREGYCRKPTI